MIIDNHHHKKTAEDYQYSPAFPEKTEALAKGYYFQRDRINAQLANALDPLSLKPREDLDNVNNYIWEAQPAELMQPSIKIDWEWSKADPYHPEYVKLDTPDPNDPARY
eukprot:TRINITY_DN4404_c0_g1_i1.p2 TRINITY_DN4404_c0_g1~~TRINITY_DN4404_c0_g1_i1.p2  ORF type:complete len:109 (-),score=33.61 TRINITY_DN4404_c0_g1_i1:60-386(-)